jgi:pimeloyl-ACP methyl ester carboxylesterase
MRKQLMQMVLILLATTFTTIAFADTPFYSTYKVSNRVEIYYEIHGEGNPHKVILLHGGLSASADWNQYIIPLLEDYGDGNFFEITAIDSRGHGRSTGTNLTYENLADDVATLMTALGINRRNKASVVGLSDGGIVALNLCIEYPQLIDRSVVIGTNIEYSEDALKSGFYKTVQTNWRWNSMINTLWSEIENSRESSPLYAHSWGEDWTKRKFKSLGRQVRSMWQSECYVPQDESDEYCGVSLGDIKASVLVGAGQNDALVKPEHTDFIAAEIPGAERWEIKGAGHAQPILDEDFTDETSGKIIDWLTR